MFARNRFSPLAPDEPLSPYPPPFEGHRVVEFKDRPVTPAEGRAPLPVNVTVPSSAQNEEQGSIHEVSTVLSVFEAYIEHGFNLAGGSHRVHPRTSATRGNRVCWC